MDNLGSTTSLGSIGYRTLDGTGNNSNNPSWESVGVSFLRMVEAVYEDGISIPVSGLPSPREISTKVLTQPH